MAQRSLNKTQLIGNLTRDPELRYTPQGTAVCTFGLATNRQWTTDAGEKREEAEFHRLVAWNKLAEICSQLLFKGRRIFVEGRLQTRQWTGQDGNARQTTEIVINDMIILDSKRGLGEETVEKKGDSYPKEPKAMKEEVPVDEGAAEAKPKGAEAKKAPAKPVAAKKATAGQEEVKADDIADDIPF